MKKEQNFIHYEISNFCKEKYYSKHNSNYWNNKKYLGIGPSAHSYNLCSRQWNISDVNEYISAVNKEKQFYKQETLSNNDKYNEYIITRLRTMWGVDTDLLKNSFDKKYLVHFLNKIDQFIASKHLKNDLSKIKLTNKGILISDKIIEELLFVN
jgi:oxygen-independent coproporphyrinogen-3 oxidase